MTIANLNAVSKYRKYAVMKNIDGSWLRDVPSHWKVSPLFNFVAEVDEKNHGKKETNVLSLSYGRVIRRDLENNHGLLPESFETYQIVMAGNIVLRLTDLQNDQSSLRVGAVQERGIITSAYVCLKTRSDIDSRFAFYYFNAFDLNKGFYSLGGGVRQTLKYQELRRLPMVLPPLPEQQAIAAFLDRETARLDALIGCKERLLELLEEKRKAIISRAVTRGLDDNVPLKDSGVEWLGQVPEHWIVTPLKFEAQMGSGHTPSRTVDAYWVDCDIPWVSLFDTGQLKSKMYIHDTSEMISDLGMQNSSARMLPKGTVVLSRDATVGRTGIMGRPMATSQHFVGWSCGRNLFNEYLYWTFHGPMQAYFNTLTNGTTISTIGMADVRQFVIPLPPFAEQHTIAAYIGMTTAKIDALREKLELSVIKLREYRTSLISAAVIGKIDVRGETPETTRETA